jgi:hypothetical protein
MAEQAFEREPERYDAGMHGPKPGRVKVTVRLSPERLERARKAVEWGYASSISAWLEAALAHHEGQFGWEPGAGLAVLDELDRIYGPPSEEANAWAQHVVFGP